MTFLIREGRVPADFEESAEVLTASDPDWPVTPDLLALWESQRDPKLAHASFVAEEGGRVIGLATVTEDDFTAEPGKFWMNVHVHPHRRRQGVGEALFGRLLEALRALNGRKVITMTSEARTETVRFALAHGFTETWRRYESRLDTGAVDFSAFDALEDGLRSRGLELRSLADLAADPERDRRLHELDWLLFQDVPIGDTPTKKDFEVWRKQELQDPHLRQDASFVVIDPTRDDPLTGPYVGYSTLVSSPAGFYMIGMTGVLRAYRGLGLAKAMKVRGMRAVRGAEIRTFNDPPNVAMLNMNAALGFVRQPPRLRLQLLLPEAPSGVN